MGAKEGPCPHHSPVRKRGQKSLVCETTTSQHEMRRKVCNLWILFGCGSVAWPAPVMSTGGLCTLNAKIKIPVMMHLALGLRRMRISATRMPCTHGWNFRMGNALSYLTVLDGFPLQASLPSIQSAVLIQGSLARAKRISLWQVSNMPAERFARSSCTPASVACRSGKCPERFHGDSKWVRFKTAPTQWFSSGFTLKSSQKRISDNATAWWSTPALFFRGPDAPRTSAT